MAAAAILALRALPLVRAYLDKLRGLHAGPAIAGAVLCGVAAVALAAIGIAKRPRAAGAVFAAAALAMVALSGNLAACLAAVAIGAVTFVAGDALYRLLRGEEAKPGDLTAAFAAGLVASGTLVLVLSEIGLLSRIPLCLCLGAILVARRRRLAPLANLVRRSVRLPRGDAPVGLEAAWLALTAVILLAVWAGVQAPDVSWDALAYHLPEARDIALSGAVRPLPDLHPQSLLWRGHDAWLALAFFFGGERVVPFLQFGVGLAVFGAALSLARRVGGGGAAPLVLLALAAFPTAMLQLKSAYVDWPAALLTTAAAAELAARPARGGRVRAAAFVFGGAIAVKIFAVFAAPALAVLAWRARPRRAALGAAALCLFVPLAPWLAWSEHRAGSFLAPYATSLRDLGDRVFRGEYFTRSPASGAAREGPGSVERLAALPRLPWDLVFHSSRYEGNGDGYNGILVLLLLTGLLGWNARRIGTFSAVSVPFLVPWALLYLPSIRFLLPVYPMYAVFTAVGLRRLAGRFADAPGLAAGVAVAAAAAAFPVQLGSTGIEWRTALGRMSRAEALAARLPSLPLFERLGSADRVLFLGENDRFHCPASAVWRGEFLPVAGWGRDEASWRSGLAELGITAVVVRADRVPEAGLPPALALASPEVVNGPATLYRFPLLR